MPLVDAGIRRAMENKAQSMRINTETNTRPNLRGDFSGVVGKLRAIKFYAWEKYFMDSKMYKTNTENPLIGIAKSVVEVVGSAAPQVASAIVLISHVSSGKTLSYVDMAIMMSSINSLMQFTGLIARIPKAIESIHKLEDLFQHILGYHQTNYIAHTLNHEKLLGSVVMDGCQFSWGPDKFTIPQTTLDIQAGEFVAVIGRIGSGKSSLMSAICGEMPMTGGSGCVYGRIGYVSQKPWIMNATLRENILMDSEFDQKAYNRIIEACALVDDISQLPAGDMSEIGTRGINLSGGQKARLALAR
ncbi:Canalicular multispecific organic anion transporter 1 [Coemansia sp. RSA 552]|nr:Canalicular multispecific organic anion transporter 1 [Coemansia sp. RSA 552]